ncbi:MAG: homocysteine S-methyltransferase family protein [Actinobacteria bacterium]|nr:homocysteine S-methyltransferase family protein [Actinomycetota bacterium]
MTRPTILDGGMGQELIRRGAPRSAELWSAWAMLEDPALVAGIHADYLAAGCDVLTTNTYSTFADRLEQFDLGGRSDELTRLAGSLAREAAAAADRPVLVAASLPPMRGSYNPGPDATYEELFDEYQITVDQLSDSADLFLCETMGACFEARAATDAARTSGLPVWVAFTLQGAGGHHLLDGTSFAEAVETIDADAYLLNCCPPEQVTEALPQLRSATDLPVGAYANAFHDMPVGWRGRDGHDLPAGRTAMGAERYAEAARRWVDMGADIVGGCCEIGPGHIARLVAEFAA